MENITNQQVGSRIAKARVAMKLTQAELASEMSAFLGREVRPLTVTRLEGGKRPIVVDELVAAAETLKIKPADLLTDDDLPMGSIMITSAYQAVQRASNKLITAVQEFNSAQQRLDEVLERTDEKHLDRLPGTTKIAIWTMRQLTPEYFLDEGRKARSGQDDSDT